MVLKQVLRDIQKEWTWAIFYIIVATMTAMAILYLSVSFSSVRKQYSSIRSYIDKEVVMFQFMPTQMEPASSNRQISNSPDVISYLQHNLSADGNAGSYVFIGNDGFVDAKYGSILILFGQYGNLAGLDYESSMAFFTPESHKEDVGKSFTIAGQKIDVIGTVGSDFDLFNPIYYIEAENPMLSNALILCTRDFQTIDAMFPWWRLSSEVFGRMVLLNPSDAEINQLQSMFYNEYGALYRGISTEEFTKTTTVASIRAHRLYIWFYILSGVLLLLLLLCNIIRLHRTPPIRCAHRHDSTTCGRLCPRFACPSHCRHRVCSGCQSDGVMVSPAVTRFSNFHSVYFFGQLCREKNRYIKRLGEFEEGLLMDILSIRQVSKSFLDHDTTVQAVSNVSLTVSLGKMVAIMGPSGSGKTTLLNLMGIVLAPDSGEIFVDGQNTSRLNDRQRCQLRNRYFGYIVQDFALIEEDSAWQNILVPTLYSKRKKSVAEYRRITQKLADKLHVTDKLNTTVRNLSGGERQRVAIIRSMICDQQIILADEPTGALDQENSLIVMMYLRETVNYKNKAVVIVTHDLDIARQCDQVYRLTRGSLSMCLPSDL